MQTSLQLRCYSLPSNCFIEHSIDTGSDQEHDMYSSTSIMVTFDSNIKPGYSSKFEPTVTKSYFMTAVHSEVTHTQ